MANNSGVQQQQSQFPSPVNTPFHCKECGISLNSAESLDVHLQYHKENLLKHWAIQAQSSHNEETNNNTTATAAKAGIKRELIPNNSISAAADSCDSMQKKSPDYSRATPDPVFGHPPTPQSYQSASSPYQNHDNSAFSPNFANYQQIKAERSSPAPQFQHNYTNYAEQQQYFAMDNSSQGQQQYNQDSFVHKPMHGATTLYRYHPYSQSPYERQPQVQVSSSSPAYPPQPTPSPSPKQCDKCGYVCESASQLIEHLNMTHPPTPAPHLSAYQPNQHFMFDQHSIVKQEENAQSEILDLDSHKVVHDAYSEDDKRSNGDPSNPHSVSTMLNAWSPQQKMFQDAQRLYMNTSEQKMYTENIQIQNTDFIGNGVTTNSQENSGNQTGQNYRPFEHMPSPSSGQMISSTQVPNAPPQPTQGTQKSSNWKSNEARRPKTYNCTACNKWFTSSGHLKRHYNTTLHKNAVKSSGQPDPASLPISAHHHPARDNNTSKQEDIPQSGSSGDEIRSGEDTNSMSQFERLNSMPGLLQQPPNGPYDRQPTPNIHHTNLSSGSPPNGEAGLSTNNLDSRGLLSSLNPPPVNTGLHGFNMAPQHMVPMENNQFQMYPNEYAPHVTQAMAINNLNTTGEYHQFIAVAEENQPLPSFAQIQSYRCGPLHYDIANVGGGGSATAPFTYYHEQNCTPDPNEDYKLTVLTTADPAPQDEYILSYSPGTNNGEELNMISLTSGNDTSKVQIMEETKMQIMEDIKLRLEAQPKSPEKAHTKRDYEEHTRNPLISSTVINKPGIHKCYDCDKVFNKACYLTQHNKTFHSGDKPFKCTRCGKRFSCEGTYQEHLTKHAGEKPHKCDVCPKQFNHKTDLRRHMCLHTGQKPYACDTCGKGFIRKDHMMKHCETHVRKTQSKIAAIR